MQTKIKTRKVAPLPELAAQRKVKVIESHKAAVDTTSDPLTAYLPLADAGYLRDQRIHESAHIKWTPAEAPTAIADRENIDEQMLQVCEDARVNSLAIRAGVKLDWLSEPHSAKALVRLLAESGSLEDCTKLALARTSVLAESRLISREFRRTPTGRAALQIANQARRKINSSFASTIDASRFLTSIFSKIKAESETAPTYPLDPKLPPLDFPPIDTFTDALLSYETETEDTDSMCKRWGPMTILTPPRFVPCSLARRGLRPTVSDTGLIPNRIHRLPVDGQIFATLRKTKSHGSILIDCSGSMHVPWNSLSDWLRRCPSATVALYSSTDESCRAGKLVIIAQNGTRVDSLPEMASGNVVDGPALRWLARQPKPRSWVCDGKTTGIGDDAYGHAECLMLCRIYSITRIPTIADFLANH